jgi:hypothetical protein
MSKFVGSKFRLALGTAISAALLLPLAVFGGTGSAQGTSAAAGQYKVTICHHTKSKKHPSHTIRISIKAWPAHERHGDTMGACPATAANASKSHKAKKSNKNQSKSKGKSENHSQSQSPSNGKGKGKGK